MINQECIDRELIHGETSAARSIRPRANRGENSTRQKNLETRTPKGIFTGLLVSAGLWIITIGVVFIVSKSI